MATTDIERDLKRLEAELKRLETEYNMFFAGRLPKPPWDTRGRVDAIIKQYDRSHIRSLVDRFRFSTLQARYSTFADLWDRGLRAREEGRPGPFAHRGGDADSKKKTTDTRILHVSAFADPVQEIDKLTELYESLSEARRETGQDQIPFHKFAELVKGQVKKLRADGSPEVAFRVAVKSGKVSFTARALRGVKKE